jgi:lipopolysaccharide transport protein LptA
VVTTAWLVVLLLVSCGRLSEDEGAAVASAPLEGVVLEVATAQGPVVLSLASAWVEDEGEGRGVEARLTAGPVDKPPQLTVTSRTSRWRLADRVMVFEGQVRATRGDLVMTCEALEVVSSDDRVEHATARGAVEVQRGNQVARAELATLDVASGRLVLEEAAHLSEGPHTMRGERVTFHLDEDLVVCDACQVVISGAAMSPVDVAR